MCRKPTSQHPTQTFPHLKEILYRHTIAFSSTDGAGALQGNNAMVNRVILAIDCLRSKNPQCTPNKSGE
jgi:hypothetical protein